MERRVVSAVLLVGTLLVVGALVSNSNAPAAVVSEAAAEPAAQPAPKLPLLKMARTGGKAKTEASPDSLLWHVEQHTTLYRDVVLVQELVPRRHRAHDRGGAHRPQPLNQHHLIAGLVEGKKLPKISMFFFSLE